MAITSAIKQLRWDNNISLNCDINICHNNGNNISQKSGINICLMSTILQSSFNIHHQWQYHQPFPIIVWVKTFSHTPCGVTKFAGKTFSSDLRKLTAVSESLSKFKNKISVIEKIIWYIETNRMRNLHLHIREEYGIENVWRWEKLEYKMTAFQNHRIFSLRCLKEDLIPVSVQLRSNVKTSRARIITRKVERALLNERIRTINNTIAMATSKRDTCMNTLLAIFPKEIMDECAKLINLRGEAYYIKVKTDK